MIYLSVALGLIEHEVGGSVNLLEPAREWKSFDEADFINTCELSFIEKVAKFSNACLNRRCNGTIYFGVKDKNSFTKAGNEFRQGEITGIQVKEDEVSVIEDWMAKYFRGANPICYKNVNNDEVKMAVTASIGRVRVIPVDEIEDRIVIEVDIEPSTENCKELCFPVYLPDVGSRKIGKVVNDSAFYIREGPSSDKVTKKKDIDDLRKLRIPAYANTRAKQETQNKLDFGSLNVKFKELFCKRESYINSEDTKYIACIDKLSGNLEEKEFIGWISRIGWHAVYDFDASKEIGKTTNEMIRQVNTFEVEDFAQKIQNKSQDLVRKEIHLGLSTIWLKCDNNLEYKEWRKEKKDSINKSLEFFTNPRITDDLRKFTFIFPLFASESVPKISAMILQVYEILKGFEKIVILYSDGNLMNQYQEKLEQEIGPEEWERHSQQVTWEQLDAFVSENTNKKRNKIDDQVLVPGSSGIQISIKNQIKESLNINGIDIIGSNTVNYLYEEKDKKEQEKMIRKFTRDFTTGKKPEWEVFLLSEPAKYPMKFNAPNPLVERSLTNDLQEKILDLETYKKSVYLIPLLHNPGITILLYILMSSVNQNLFQELEQLH